MDRNLLNQQRRLRNVDMICMFCGSGVSFRMKLLHERYCSTEHKEAYFHAMDRIGLERLTAARPRNTSYEPCTKPLDFGVQSQAEPVQAPVKFAATRMRPHLELGQGEAAAVAGI
jgi:hypothetical protein